MINSYVIVFFYLQINAIRSIVPNRSNNEIVLVLQQFDNNVDKTVQAFMDGEYSVPFSLMQEGFSHVPKYLLSLVAQNIYSVVLLKSDVWHLLIIKKLILLSASSLLHSTRLTWLFICYTWLCHFWSHSYCRPPSLFCVKVNAFKVIRQEIIHCWRYSN